MQDEDAAKSHYRGEKQRISQRISEMEQQLESTGYPLELSMDLLPQIEEERQRAQWFIDRERASIDYAWRHYDHLWGNG